MKKLAEFIMRNELKLKNLMVLTIISAVVLFGGVSVNARIVQSNAGTKTATIEWDPVDNAVEYKIYKSYGKGLYWKKQDVYVGKTSSTRFKIKGLNNKYYNYIYIVIVEEKDGVRREYQNSQMNEKIALKPTQIKGVKLRPNPLSDSVEWKENDNADEYQIQIYKGKKKIASTKTEYLSSGIGNLTFNGKKMKKGVKYRLRVRGIAKTTVTYEKSYYGKWSKYLNFVFRG